MIQTKITNTDDNSSNHMRFHPTFKIKLFTDENIFKILSEYPHCYYPGRM